MSGGDRPIGVYRRGKIVSLSAAAERAGLKLGMPLAQARAICPEVEFMPFDEGRYRAWWRQALDICVAHVGAIEPAELGEVFIDLDRPGTSPPTLNAIRRDIEEKTRFTCLTGGGPSKLVAKIAALVRPGKIIAAKDTINFLAPLPISRLWLLKPKTLEQLQALGITTLGLLQQLSITQLAEHFGKDARRLYELARGHDHSPIKPTYPPRSLTVRMALGGGVDNLQILDNCLQKLAQKLAHRLQRHQEACQRLSLRVELEDGHKISRALKLHTPTYHEQDILRLCRFLLAKINLSAPISAVAVRVANLQPLTSLQLSLFPEAEPAFMKFGRAQKALASVQQHFGHWAARLGTEFEIPRRERVLAVMYDEGTI